jgi:hypothetical protein
MSVEKEEKLLFIYGFCFFLFQMGLRKLVENKLVDTLKNKYRPHPHSAICMSESHLCIVKLVGEETN